MYFFVGLGSNIQPERHVVAMVEALLTVSPTVALSRVIKTEPVGLQTEHYFLNLCARIKLEPECTEGWLKSYFNEVEGRLGRNRNDPERKGKDRVADLDILFGMPAGNRRIEGRVVPAEPYLRPLLLELIHFLQLECELAVPEMSAGIPLTLQSYQFGKEPTILKGISHEPFPYTP